MSNLDERIASYNITSIIAKRSKHHSIGESLVGPVISEIPSTVFRQNTIENTIENVKHIPLSKEISEKVHGQNGR